MLSQDWLFSCHVVLPRKQQMPILSRCERSQTCEGYSALSSSVLLPSTSACDVGEKINVLVFGDL